MNIISIKTQRASDERKAIKGIKNDQNLGMTHRGGYDPPCDFVTLVLDEYLR